MLMKAENKKIFIAQKPVDFRMSIDSLARFISQENKTHLYDGSIYVFHNLHQDKIKCLFWDKNGFVLYYKRLDKCKFRFRKMLNSIENIDSDELNTLLAGLEPGRKALTHEG